MVKNNQIGILLGPSIYSKNLENIMETTDQSIPLPDITDTDIDVKFLENNEPSLHLSYNFYKSESPSNN